MSVKRRENFERKPTVIIMKLAAHWLVFQSSRFNPRCYATKSSPTFFLESQSRRKAEQGKLGFISEFSLAPTLFLLADYWCWTWYCSCGPERLPPVRTFLFETLRVIGEALFPLSLVPGTTKTLLAYFYFWRRLFYVFSIENRWSTVNGGKGKVISGAAVRRNWKINLYIRN